MVSLLSRLRRALPNPPEAAPDAQLLERFARERDELAFEALVLRHGPMVLGVCRRLPTRSHVGRSPGGPPLAHPQRAADRVAATAAPKKIRMTQAGRIGSNTERAPEHPRGP